MQASEIEAGIYVRPVKNAQKFDQGLYEVQERTPAGKVLLIDCRFDIGEYQEPVESSVMQLVQSFVLVKPKIDMADLDELPSGMSDETIIENENYLLIVSAALTALKRIETQHQHPEIPSDLTIDQVARRTIDNIQAMLGAM